ncbi:MAG: alpha/beta fold hydrolase [Solirubrobacteraceae bacterium]
MPILETARGPLAYDERGAGHPIVLLASGAHDRHDFDELRDLLPDRFRSISLDWPGHGESPPGRSAASAMSFADVAEELVSRLVPEGAVLVGNSVGGFSAARMALRRPELIRGLVLVDSGGFIGRPPHVRAFCALMARPWFLRRIYPSFATRYMRPRTAADLRARDVGVATTRRDPGLRAVSELWRSFASPEHDLRRDASSITAPTLLIWGRRDPVIPLRVGRRLATTIPGAELVVLDTGHVPHTTEPEQFAAHLVSFADRSFDRSSSAQLPA